MIRVNRTIAIDESEIQEEFIRASGPGGQNVNKAATAVQLRFDTANSLSLPDEGVLVIDARRYRSQKANRRDAMERLVGLIRKAAQKPRIRRKTKPTLASKIRRLEDKQHRAKTKRLRRPIQEMADG